VEICGRNLTRSIENQGIAFNEEVCQQTTLAPLKYQIREKFDGIMF
jgi:hypothetical protein